MHDDSVPVASDLFQVEIPDGWVLRQVSEPEANRVGHVWIGDVREEGQERVLLVVGSRVVAVWTQIRARSVQLCMSGSI